jgi:polysaccharide pyruvyl transferase WcaK-like protein
MKKTLKKIYHAIKHKFRLTQAIRNWQQAKLELVSNQVKRSMTEASSASAKKVLIYPSDLSTIIGALGDDAMISASLDQLKKTHPDLEVYMLCKPTSKDVVESLGYKSVAFPSLDLDAHPMFFKSLYESLSIDYLVVLGADIMDGYYGLTHPASALIAADLAAANGIKPIVLGFSFNKAPNKDLANFYKRLDQRLILNVRDDISLGRIRDFTTANSELVADVAFCLIPTTVPPDVKKWIEEQKNNGNQIVGFNVHPMLLKSASEENIQNIVESAVYSIKNLSENLKVSFLLLPHDYRGKNGDAICLEPIYERLKNDSKINAFFLEGKHRASVLKAIAGMLDGVVTGRMHLAIASLGMETPTMCITYQDKFEGLYRHFSLPNKLLLSPQTMMDKDTFTKELTDFVSELSTLKSIVSSKAPTVRSLSEKNFINL